MLYVYDRKLKEFKISQLSPLKSTVWVGGGKAIMPTTWSRKCLKEISFKVLATNQR